MHVASTACRRGLSSKALPGHYLTTSSPPSPSEAAAAESASKMASIGSTELAAAQETELALDSLQKPISPLESNKTPKKKVVRRHYQDHSADSCADPSLIEHKGKGGTMVPFPIKLHVMLEEVEADGMAHVVSWRPHGRCFVVHEPREFVDRVMPHYFNQTKMASFQRQLNLYGFNSLTSGPDKGGYYHEMFLRGRAGLAYGIRRTKVKGTGVRPPANRDDEPNFYALTPVADADPSAALSPPAAHKTVLPDAHTMISTAKKRAELLPNSHDHSQKIAESNTQLHGAAPKASSPDAHDMASMAKKTAELVVGSRNLFRKIAESKKQLQEAALEASSLDAHAMASMAKKRAELLPESHNLLRKIAESKKQLHEAALESSLLDAQAAASMAKTRAGLLPESHDHSQKIAEGKKQVQDVDTVIFFEGMPFHYLAPWTLSSMPDAKMQPYPAKHQRAPPSPVAKTQHRKPAMAHSPSATVSESDTDNEMDGDALPPNLFTFQH